MNKFLEAIRAPLKSVYVLFGGNDFLKNLFIEKIRSRLGKSHNYVRIKIESADDLQKLTQELNDFGLFGFKKLIVVELNENLSREFANYWRRTFLPNVIVILTCNKDIPITGEHILCRQVTHENLGAFIQYMSKMFNKYIDQKALEMMRNYFSPDNPGVIYKEIEKLATYIGERNRITADDVEEVSNIFPLEKIYELEGEIEKKDLTGLFQKFFRLMDVPRKIKVKGKKQTRGDELFNALKNYIFKGLELKYLHKPIKKRENIIYNKIKSLTDEEFKKRIDLLLNAEILRRFENIDLALKEFLLGLVQSQDARSSTS